MINSKILLVEMVSLFMFSCRKDEAPSINEKEAVEIIENYLVEESAGLEETTNEYSKTYEEQTSLNIQCNQQVTDSYTYSKILMKCNIDDLTKK
jgi:hypothetical protein